MKNIIFIFLLYAFAGCKGDTDKANNPVGDDQLVINKSSILANGRLTEEEQRKLTPKIVLERLKAGNDDFIKDNLTIRNNTQRVREAALGQFPKAVILSCLDSRVPVEDVFHSGIGNLFVARVAGNIVNEDILGSLEYACKVSGARVVVVLGHEYCGAIESAIKRVELSNNVTALLKKIQPSVASVRKTFVGDTVYTNPKFVQAVCDANVFYSVKQIRDKSPVLAKMERDGDIAIVGAVYDMKTGKVEYLREKPE